MKVTKQNVKKAGFSLVEMLVVIAVIGIIAAIAVPNIGRINDSASDARKRRNAQSIASVYSAARAAGYDFSYPGGDNTKTELATKKLVIEAVLKGGQVSDPGPFENTKFSVPGLTSSTATDDKKGAAKYLEFAAGDGLTYRGDISK